MTEPERTAAVHYMQGLAAMPVWYEWGGSCWPPEPPHYGLDCSGAVCLALVFSRLAEPGFRVRAVDLAEKCDRIDKLDATAGDLVFYGEGGVVSHVMMILDRVRVVGAQGGRPSTTTQEIAEAADARVKILDLATYRPGDIVAFGRWRRQ